MQACFIVCLHIKSASAREVPIAVLGHSNVLDPPVCSTIDVKAVSRLLDVSISLLLVHRCLQLCIKLFLLSFHRRLLTARVFFVGQRHGGRPQVSVQPVR